MALGILLIIPRLSFLFYGKLFRGLNKLVYVRMYVKNIIQLIIFIISSIIIKPFSGKFE